MKNLIVYYSWTGNTEVVAKELHSLIGGDLEKIEEVKERKSGIGFASGAFAALLGMKSRIKQPNLPLDGYDNIFLGAQVWALNCAPAINSYLSGADLKGKNVYLFITKADEKVPQNAISSISKKVEDRGGMVVDSISITTVMKSVIAPDAAREPLKKWVDNLHMHM